MTHLTDPEDFTRKSREIVVVEIEEYGIGEKSWPASYDSTLSSFIAWLLAWREKIPAEFRDSAICEISTVDDYGSMKATLCIKYSRPETDAEFEARLEEARGRKWLRQESEKNELRRLKAKYPEI